MDATSGASQRDNHDVDDAFGVTPEDRQLFGTFRILLPLGTREEWESFKSRPFTTVMDQVLPEKTATVILCVFRRHPEHTAYFLSLLDRAAASRNSCVLYGPFICHRISQIPIQWLVRHITRISDVRFSNQIVKEAFLSLHNSSNPFEESRERNRIWHEYMELTKETVDESESEAWKQLIDIRAAIRDLMDYRLTISLVDYMRLDKNEFVRRLISQCVSAARLRTLLKTQIVPYCEAYSLKFAQSLISEAMTKDWPVQQKLEIVQEFILTRKEKKQALDTMTFEDNELETMEGFAKRHNISFVPTTEKSVKSPRASNPMTRSCSIQTIGSPIPHARALAQTARQTRPRRSPSIDLSNVARTVEAGSIMAICDGQPSDPVEYANKLNRYKNLKEFKPYFDLAESFGVVVSCRDYSTDSGKKQIFQSLLQKFGMDRFHEICETLEMDPDSVVDRMCGSGDYTANLFEAVNMLVPYLRYTNVAVYVQYVKDTVIELLGKHNIDELLECYHGGLENSLRLVEGAYIPSIVEHMRLSECIRESDSEERKVELLRTVLNRSEEIYKIFPVKNLELSKDDFVRFLLSDDNSEFTKAISQFSVLPKDVLLEGVKAAIPNVSGTEYPLLQLLCKTAKTGDESFELEMKALSVLYQITDHVIDFHELMEDPMGTIKKNITLKNVSGVLELASVFEVDIDQILVHLMIKKMSSRQFSDYLPFVAKLKLPESVKPLMHELIPRFSNTDQINFLNSIARFDMKRTNETVFDLMKNGLGEYIQDEYLENPELLITKLYTNRSIQEKLGTRVHKVAKGIASRFEIDLLNLQKQIILSMFNPKQCIEASSDSSVFNNHRHVCELQDSLFILLKWKPDVSIEFLRGILHSNETSMHQKSMATSCLAIFGDDPPEESGVPSFYWIDYESSFGTPTDRSEDFFLSLADKADTKLAKRLLTYVIDRRIQNGELILKLLDILKPVEMRFILRNVIPLFKRTGISPNDSVIFRLFLESVASPFSEMMTSDYWKQLKGRQLDVFRDMLCAIAQSPGPVKFLVCNGKEWGWSELAQKLCGIGAHTTVAELGAHLVEPESRREVLMEIMTAGHFDDALEYGFDKEEVFKFILEGSIERATEVMIDSHFVAFTIWLKHNNLTEALETVRNVLKNQGRTMELKRLEDRVRNA